MKLPFLHHMVALYLVTAATATLYVKSSSLLTCMENSQFTASFFDVVFTPNNNTATFDISAITTISGNVTAHVDLIVYGLTVLSKEFLLCSLNYGSVCPLTSGHIDIDSFYTVDKNITSMIPGIAYTIPDLDASVRVMLYAEKDPTTPLACVEAILTNGKTVLTKYAAWPIAAISGLGLVTAGVVSVIGHSNTAAHIASNSVSLFIYFQSVAMTSMMGVYRVPPMAAAWAQNFQWTMGIIKVGVIQRFANWYVQATGGTSTSILYNQQYLSISPQKKIKRSLDFVNDITQYAADPGMSFVSRQVRKIPQLLKRVQLAYNIDVEDSNLYTTNEKSADLSGKILVLRGIQRVSFLAGIEITNLFMTAMAFTLFFGLVLLVCLVLFKAAIELCIRTNVMNEGKFHEYRKQWPIIVKGVLYRLALIAFPQLGVLCFWQLLERDSVGCIIIAIVLLAVVIGLLFQAAVRVVLIARNSIRMYKNPAYLLYGDSKVLNRFGFLYVQYSADAYYWVIVHLCYVLFRSLVIGVAQSNGKAQSLIVFIIEIAYFGGLCWRRPYMDKRTNVFNILIGVVSVLNAIFYVFFSNLFGQAAVVSSVMAVVLFVLNAVFSLVLLVFTIVTCSLALIYKNPDTRYQPMKDDRVSFIPKGMNVSDSKEGGGFELAALGAAAMRGHDQTKYDDDSVLFDANSDERGRLNSGQSSSRSSFTAVQPGSAVGNNYGRLEYVGNYNQLRTNENVRWGL
ncbi:hypothetical protein BABINDRAFT_162335 [Babjeviella inositovora NRRL Y-12698]|uniref:ML-like domain-containing protein n=1 Tax=Babjeviella inositovora NRRL Y-12698 TaxID=984486 RepID=A0A1E3QLQ6_9ASCO|nr:uncharacterized protein BABINDRAFT_162335 [Babjeviella inositovora NRRL Y-12698]ODQ78623.1 hypothetical protein BABINDRAFT_162335 [Babjeviella inositovora NRRL Y-12698]